MTPTLKTGRLILAPPIIHEQMDVSHYLKWLNNRKVVMYSEQRHKEHTAKTQFDFLCSFGGDNQIWEIVVAGNTIGAITAYRNTPNKTANLGIMLGEPRTWGRGYGPEAWDAVCQYLFEDDIRKVEAGCMACNEAMIKVLTKCGFTHEATMPNYFLFNGNPEDMNYYGKYREAKIIPIGKKEGKAAQDHSGASRV
jgi:[ribosomal protein S5]-alanine N-acetyltransferase